MNETSCDGGLLCLVGQFIYGCLIGFLCRVNLYDLFCHLNVSCVHLEAFEQNYMYRCVTMGSNVHNAGGLQFCICICSSQLSLLHGKAYK